MKRLKKLIAVSLVALTLTVGVGSAVGACYVDGDIKWDCQGCDCANSSNYGRHQYKVKDSYRDKAGKWHTLYQCRGCNDTYSETD